MWKAEHLFRRAIAAESVLGSLLLLYHGLFSVTGLFSSKGSSLSSLYSAPMGKGREEVASATFTQVRSSRL